MSLEEIERNDWNLNIRRYVDNTPEPEPEDVRAHLIGGVPVVEVTVHSTGSARFGIKPDLVFVTRDTAYYDFRPETATRAALKAAIEVAPGVNDTLAGSRTRLIEWWAEASADFAGLANAAAEQPNGVTQLQTRDGAAAYLTLSGSKLPLVRRALIESLKAQLVPLGVLDRFQAAGVFANWWDGIKYDLRTIMQNGWSPTLIPDEYLIETFFQLEAAEIEELEAGIGEQEAALAEAVEAAQALLEYEPEEGETVTATLMRKELAAAIKDLKTSHGLQAKVELQSHQEALAAITGAEEKLKEFKGMLERRRFELELKLLLKRFGPEDETYDSRRASGPGRRKS